MPTANEIRVLKLLSAIEIPPTAGQTIQSWGNEAVTIVCEAALDTYPGLRSKVRNNAVALLGWMNHQHAMETVPLLLTDVNTDVSIRAMRAVCRQKNEVSVDKLGQSGGLAASREQGGRGRAVCDGRVINRGLLTLVVGEGGSGAVLTGASLAFVRAALRIPSAHGPSTHPRSISRRAIH